MARRIACHDCGYPTGESLFDSPADFLTAVPAAEDSFQWPVYDEAKGG